MLLENGQNFLVMLGLLSENDCITSRLELIGTINNLHNILLLLFQLHVKENKFYFCNIDFFNSGAFSLSAVPLVILSFTLYLSLTITKLKAAH